MTPTARDEVIRRLRDESARRIQRRGRVRAFSSWCALATLAAGISLAALDAHQARLRATAAETAARRAAADRRLFEEKLVQIARQRQAVRSCHPYRTSGEEERSRLIRALREAERRTADDRANHHVRKRPRSAPEDPLAGVDWPLHVLIH
jgi:hypothetical protein